MAKVTKMSGAHRCGAFTIVREGTNVVAINTDATSDGAFLEIQSDSYDALVEAIEAIDRVCETYNPQTREFGPMPDWLKPFMIDGDPTRVVLPSKDLRRLLGVPAALRSGALAVAGSLVAASIWACVSTSTFVGFDAIGYTARHLI